MQKLLLMMITTLCGYAHLEAATPDRLLSLRCEYRINPLGVEAANPRLSWVMEAGDESGTTERGIKQTAYQVFVASTLVLLGKDEGDLWDSGLIKSDASVQVKYSGHPLASHQKVFWKVRVHTSDGIEVESDVGNWTMGFLSAEDWSARWIGSAVKDKGLPVFRKKFVVDEEIRNALVHVSGLGHYELFLNGEKVGNQFLAPAWSVYEKTVYYNTFDLSQLLKHGENEFRIMLGKGFYNTEGDRYMKKVIKGRGRLMAILEAHLDYADGRKEVVRTDESWDVASGPITHSGILGGSDFDSRIAEPAKWMNAVEVESAAQLRAAESPAMEKMEALVPVGDPDEPEPGVFVYDFGQNLSAIPSIQVRGEKGAVLRLTPAEQRHGQADRTNNGKGRVNQAGIGSPNYYEYTLNGSGQERWQPQFAYTGFQYLELTGAVPAGYPNPNNLPVLEVIQSVHVRSSARPVGSFSCSNPLWVKIDEIIDRAVRSNLGHVLTDCPTREKLGWLEVSYLMGPALSRRYDLSRLYAKITRDIRDSQGADGAIYTVAPSFPDFSGIDWPPPHGGLHYTPEWGAAGVVVPWQLYRWYGDKAILRENFLAMKAFVDYMKNTSEDLVPKPGLGDWFDYGHGKNLGPSRFTPAKLTAMATFYRCTDIVAKSAEVLGEKDDSENYQNLADDIRSKFNQTYYLGNGQYHNKKSPQTANAMALVTGLCEPENEEAVLDAILADLEKRHYQQTAGDIGFHYLVEALSRNGRHDVLQKVLNRRDKGSYGFFVDKGWTSLPEAWDATTRSSMNHLMLGHIQQWFYYDLLGIQQADDSVGYKHIVIKPAFESEVEWVKGHYDSIYGRISVAWSKKNGACSLNVTIPANTKATIYLPVKNGASVRESGKPAEQAEGVTFLAMEKGGAAIQIGSGKYAFVFKLNQ